NRRLATPKVVGGAPFVGERRYRLRCGSTGLRRVVPSTVGPEGAYGVARIGDGGDLLKCSFCGKSQKQVKKLIAGPGVYICDECIDLCNEIIEEELGDTPEGGMRELPKPQIGRASCRERVSVAVVDVPLKEINTVRRLRPNTSGWILGCMLS